MTNESYQVSGYNNSMDAVFESIINSYSPPPLPPSSSPPSLLPAAPQPRSFDVNTNDDICTESTGLTQMTWTQIERFFAPPSPETETNQISSSFIYPTQSQVVSPPQRTDVAGMPAASLHRPDSSMNRLKRSLCQEGRALSSATAGKRKTIAIKEISEFEYPASSIEIAAAEEIIDGQLGPELARSSTKKINELLDGWRTYVNSLDRFRNDVNTGQFQDLPKHGCTFSTVSNRKKVGQQNGTASEVAARIFGDLDLSDLDLTPLAGVTDSSTVEGFQKASLSLRSAKPTMPTMGIMKASSLKPASRDHSGSTARIFGDLDLTGINLSPLTSFSSAGRGSFQRASSAVNSSSSSLAVKKVKPLSNVNETCASLKRIFADLDLSGINMSPLNKVAGGFEKASSTRSPSTEPSLKEDSVIIPSSNLDEFPSDGCSKDRLQLKGGTHPVHRSLRIRPAGQTVKRQRTPVAAAIASGFRPFKAPRRTAVQDQPLAANRSSSVLPEARSPAKTLPSFCQHHSKPVGSLFQLKTSSGYGEKKTALDQFSLASSMLRETDELPAVVQNLPTAEQFLFTAKRLDCRTVEFGGGHRLVFSGNDEQIGYTEIYRSIKESVPCWNQSVASELWLRNHFAQIVWKLSSLRCRFSKDEFFTLQRVLAQLEYRYDAEVGRGFRSCLRKIFERDDASTKAMILFVTSVGDSNFVQLSDGWYTIRAQLDSVLQSLVERGNLFVGRKLAICNAELVSASNDGCSPLDSNAFGSVHLRLFANSTRPAKWSAKLGFTGTSIRLPLNSMHPNGGVCADLDVVVSRIYPMSALLRNGQVKARFMPLACSHGLSTSAQSDGIEDADQNSAKSLVNRYRRSRDPEGFLAELSEEDRLKLNDELQRQQQSSASVDAIPLLKIRVCSLHGNDIGQRAGTLLTIWRPDENTTDFLREGSCYRLRQMLATTGYHSNSLAPTNCPLSLSTQKSSSIRPRSIDEDLVDMVLVRRSVLAFSVLRRFYRSQVLSSKSETSFLGANSEFSYEIDLVGVVAQAEDESRTADLSRMFDLRLGAGHRLVFLCNGGQMVVTLVVPCDLLPIARALFHVGSFVAVKNLVFARQPTNINGSFGWQWPLMLFTEYCQVKTGPVEQYLRVAIEQLRQEHGDDWTNVVTDTSERLIEPFLETTPWPSPFYSSPVTGSRLLPASRPASCSPMTTPVGHSRGKRNRSGCLDGLTDQVAPLSSPIPEKVRRSFKAPSYV